MQKILVLDFGGQYSKLIARRVRELGVYSEILSFKTPVETIKENNYHGIIFSGGPSSVYEDNAPTVDKKIFDISVPILGICYGAQLMAKLLGGEVAKSTVKEYGNTQIELTENLSPILKKIKSPNTVWMSHTDYISKVPKGFIITSTTKDCPVASMGHLSKNFFALQFHPEVTNTKHGQAMIKAFLYDICKCSKTWKTASFTTTAIEEIKAKVGDKKVLCALSGGVDSSVAAILVSKAIGNNLTCVFVDHGLLRKNEADDIERIFSKELGLNLICVDARKRFLGKLKGVTDPEKKRKIIGREFIKVFEIEAKKLKGIDYLVQGTIYPDIIESGAGPSALIKSHHNVGGLPKNHMFKEIIEPLRNLFKDEVRNVGRGLNIPDMIIDRQPFPGPGLGVRIIGKITDKKIALLQEADHIFTEEIRLAGLHSKINQYFAVLTDMRSVGVMGDARTYFYTVGLRAVVTSDFMTATWAEIPNDVLARVSTRIVNEVEGVNRIVYDITNKPPATIEWL